MPSSFEYSEPSMSFSKKRRFRCEDPRQGRLVGDVPGAAHRTVSLAELGRDAIFLVDDRAGLSLFGETHLNRACLALAERCLAAHIGGRVGVPLKPDVAASLRANLSVAGPSPGPFGLKSPRRSVRVRDS